MLWHNGEASQILSKEDKGCIFFVILHSTNILVYCLNILAIKEVIFCMLLLILRKGCHE